MNDFFECPLPSFQSVFLNRIYRNLIPLPSPNESESLNLNENFQFINQPISYASIYDEEQNNSGLLLDYSEWIDSSKSIKPSKLLSEPLEVYRQQESSGNISFAQQEGKEVETEDNTSVNTSKIKSANPPTIDIEAEVPSSLYLNKNASPDSEKESTPSSNLTQNSEAHNECVCQKQNVNLCSSKKTTLSLTEDVLGVDWPSHTQPSICDNQEKNFMRKNSSKKQKLYHEENDSTKNSPEDAVIEGTCSTKINSIKQYLMKSGLSASTGKSEKSSLDALEVKNASSSLKANLEVEVASPNNSSLTHTEQDVFPVEAPSITQPSSSDIHEKNLNEKRNLEPKLTSKGKLSVNINPEDAVSFGSQENENTCLPTNLNLKRHNEENCSFGIKDASEKFFQDDLEFKLSTDSVKVAPVTFSPTNDALPIAGLSGIQSSSCDFQKKHATEKRNMESKLINERNLCADNDPKVTIPTGIHENEYVTLQNDLNLNRNFEEHSNFSKDKDASEKPLQDNLEVESASLKTLVLTTENDALIVRSQYQPSISIIQQKSVTVKRNLKPRIIHKRNPINNPEIEISARTQENENTHLPHNSNLKRHSEEDSDFSKQKNALEKPSHDNPEVESASLNKIMLTNESDVLFVPAPTEIQPSSSDIHQKPVTKKRSRRPKLKKRRNLWDNYEPKVKISTRAEKKENSSLSNKSNLNGHYEEHSEFSKNKDASEKSFHYDASLNKITLTPAANVLIDTGPSQFRPSTNNIHKKLVPLKRNLKPKAINKNPCADHEVLNFTGTQEGEHIFSNDSKLKNPSDVLTNFIKNKDSSKKFKDYQEIETTSQNKLTLTPTIDVLTVAKPPQIQPSSYIIYQKNSPVKRNLRPKRRNKRNPCADTDLEVAFSTGTQEDENNDLPTNSNFKRRSERRKTKIIYKQSSQDELEIEAESNSRSKIFICEICGKEFDKNSKLKRHLTVHSGAKAFYCNICQRGYAQKCYLGRHLQIHSGERPFKCDVCGKEFTQQCNLKRHAVVHTGKTPFICGICLKGFAFKGDVNKHMLVHTSEKPTKNNISEEKIVFLIPLPGYRPKGNEPIIRLDQKVPNGQ